MYLLSQEFLKSNMYYKKCEKFIFIQSKSIDRPNKDHTHTHFVTFQTSLYMFCYLRVGTNCRWFIISPFTMIIHSRQDGFPTKPCNENSFKYARYRWSSNFTLLMCKTWKSLYDFKCKRFKGRNIWFNFWFKGRYFNFTEISWHAKCWVL